MPRSAAAFLRATQIAPVGTRYKGVPNRTDWHASPPLTVNRPLVLICQSRILSRFLVMCLRSVDPIIATSALIGESRAVPSNLDPSVARGHLRRSRRLVHRHDPPPLQFEMCPVPVTHRPSTGETTVRPPSRIRAASNSSGSIEKTWVFPSLYPRIDRLSSDSSSVSTSYTPGGWEWVPERHGLSSCSTCHRVGPFVGYADMSFEFYGWATCSS